MRVNNRPFRVSLSAVSKPLVAVIAADSIAVAKSEGRIRTELSIELNHPPNLERLVLGCIDADFCK